MELLKDLFAPKQQYDDPKVYELISSGKTKGIFQLESGLLSSYSKKLKPNCIEDISALVALVRPGCLESKDSISGLNMAQLFCARKNGELPVTYEFPQLEPHLKNTYGVIVYQETILEIAKDIASFSLKDADLLRIACGKKIAEKMTEVKKLFLAGCETTGKVTTEEAEKIFDWIEKSQRYLFNASHSMAYAIQAYASAWFKVHYPIEFYTAWLRHARDKQNPFEEIRDLVNDAKSANIDVMLPNLSVGDSPKKHFYNSKNSIYFGIGDIRSIGDKAYEKLTTFLKTVQITDWDSFLIDSLENINSSVFQALICSGALDFFQIPRQRMLFEFQNIKNITENDIKYFKQFNGPIVDRLSTIVPTTKINNRKIPEKKYKFFQSILTSFLNPPFKLIDSVDFLVYNEEEYLGIPVSCSSVDGKDTSQANCNISDIVNNRIDDYICVGVVIDSARQYKMKNGKYMTFLKVSDASGSIESVAFAEATKDYGHLLTEKNTVLVRGKRGKDRNGFIVEKVWSL